MAVAAAGVIKFYEAKPTADSLEWSECVQDKIEIQKGCGKITKMHWTQDGSILTVTTSNGYFLGFLTIIPSLCSSFETYAGILSSLTEVSVVDCTKSNQVIAKTELEVEPTFLHMGPSHVAVGINNQIWYYRWRSGHGPEPEIIDTASLMCKREHFGTIKQVVMNNTWTAVLSDGKVALHCIEDQSQNDIKFPQNQGDKPLAYIALADSFLLMIDTAGKLVFYLIEDGSFITEHKGQNPLVKVFPNKSGTKCICIDNTGNGYLYNPVKDTCMMIPNF
jgi:WD repeat-containing protein 19